MTGTLGGTNEAHNVGNVGGGDWSVDGVPDTGNGYAAAYLPYSTTISEYKVVTENFDASVGHSSGMAISIMTKSALRNVTGAIAYPPFMCSGNAFNHSFGFAEGCAHGNDTASNIKRNQRSH